MDAIDGTAAAWHEALTTGRSWDYHRDVKRIRAAFVTLAQTRDTWPTPKHFLDAMPRPEAKALTHSDRPEDPEWLKQAIAEHQTGILLRKAGDPLQ